MVGQRVDECVGECAHLTVHHYGVQAFLAAEMFIDDGLRYLRGRGNLLYAYRFEPLRREQRPTDFDELLTSLK